MLLPLLAYTRIPGNAISFRLRQCLRWSRGAPKLAHESKTDLFAYARENRNLIEARANELHARYTLEPLAQCSTAALYRKNLHLLDALEQATQGLGQLPLPHGEIKALDVGSQDWYYVFALERWLRRIGRSKRQVRLAGIELDGYERFADFHTRQDYALAYARQTGNPETQYQVGDFLQFQGKDYDVVFLLYPLLIRYQLLLWGLPLRCFAPQQLVDRAVAALRPGGWLVVFCHTLREHGVALELGRGNGGVELLREGPIRASLVDFQGEQNDSRFSVWSKR
jgi:SAM-dependent methyltransferase